MLLIIPFLAIAGVMAGSSHRDVQMNAPTSCQMTVHDSQNKGQALIDVREIKDLGEMNSVTYIGLKNDQSADIKESVDQVELVINQCHKVSQL